MSLGFRKATMGARWTINGLHIEEPISMANISENLGGSVYVAGRMDR